MTATSRETALARSATTGSNGNFTIRLLPPAPYRVSALLDGFEPLAVESVRVLLGSSASLELRLKIATVAESVTVAARAALIDPTSTDVSKTIGEAMIRNLPINQRNFIDFALTTPGVVRDRGPQPGAAPTSGLSFNGQSPRYNNVLVDGLDNNDPSVGSIRTTFSQDAVEEYQVIQSPFAAEYGRASGGIVNIVTHSGSKDTHGSAFYFYRDESLAANSFLADEKTPYHQDQYGLTIGGPAARDRLFFFGAAERLAVADSNVVTIAQDSPNVVAIVRRNGFELESGVLPFDRNRSTWLLKLDWIPTARHSLSLRGTYAEEEDENQQAWGGLVARSGGGVRRLEDSALAVSAISVLSEQTSNEFRVLYSRRRHRLDSLDSTGGVAVDIPGFATFGTHQLLPQPRELTTYQVFEAVSLFRERGSYKLGFDYLHSDVEGSLPLYFSGLYRFVALPAIPGLLPGPLTAVEAFEAGIPAIFAQGFGDPTVAVRANHLGVFAQGEWNLTERFLLRLGLRYDYEDPVAPFATDSNNWAPRLSWSWAGGRTWRLRGGVGRFYGVVSFGPAVLAGIENGSRATVIVRSILGGPSPLDPWRLPDRRFANASAAGDSVVPPTVYRTGRFESVYSDQANVGFEKEVGGAILVNVDYLRVRGRKILVERNVNPQDPLNEGERPDPHFLEIFVYESSGNSWYQAFTLGARARVGVPFEVAAYYTYAVGEDDNTDWSEGQPQDPLNIAAERGPTIHVPRHKAAVSGIYSSPGSGPWWKRNWNFGIIAEYLAGLPYNELAGFDRNQNGDPVSDRPSGVGRNRQTLDDTFNVDIRVARRFRFRRLTLEGIIEAFNLFNRRNVVQVNPVRYLNTDLQPNPDFGRPTRIADPRRIQLGARVSF